VNDVRELNRNIKYSLDANGNLVLLEKESVETLAKEMYQSFLSTLKTISARIPSQAFQSFLANETVAFTEEGLTEGYMNIWEMWF